MVKSRVWPPSEKLARKPEKEKRRESSGTSQEQSRGQETASVSRRVEEERALEVMLAGQTF